MTALEYLCPAEDYPATILDSLIFGNMILWKNTRLQDFVHYSTMSDAFWADVKVQSCIKIRNKPDTAQPPFSVIRSGAP